MNKKHFINTDQTRMGVYRTYIVIHIYTYLENGDDNTLQIVCAPY